MYHLIFKATNSTLVTNLYLLAIQFSLSALVVWRLNFLWQKYHCFIFVIIFLYFYVEKNFIFKNLLFEKSYFHNKIFFVLHFQQSVFYHQSYCVLLFKLFSFIALKIKLAVVFYKNTSLNIYLFLQRVMWAVVNIVYINFSEKENF